jgi:molybdenum cofactor cytidylyltransferase
LNQAKGPITALLLAAGASRRFGADKLMHPLPGGTPIALASALSLRAALPNMLAVVRPDNAALIQLFERHGISVVPAERAAQGMGESLAAGVAASADAGGWLVALADMPSLNAATIAAVADALARGAAIAVPVFQGKRGHPVAFNARFGPQLRALAGDQGARELLREHAAEVVQVECGDAGILLDIDRPGDLAGAQTHAEAILRSDRFKPAN